MWYALYNVRDFGLMFYPAILSRRESQVYKYLCQGLQRPDIAMLLKLSYTDVYIYTCRMQKKLKLKTFTALRKYIKRNK